jgi:hypothetical protein
MQYVHFDAPVLTTKTLLLQRIADSVRMGYWWIITGQVSLERSSALVRKFRDLYLIHIGKDARYKRKRAGFGNAVLLLWQPDEEIPLLTFVLLCTESDHPAHTLEKLRDARERNTRCVITGYELLRLPRANGGPKPAWTWRMTSATFQEWRNVIRELVRRHADEELKRRWYSLHHVPGFAGLRQNARALAKLMRAEWRRARREPFPGVYLKLRYVQRLPTKSKPLSSVLAAFAKL